MTDLANQLKIEIPDAWVTEWSVLFVVHHTYRRTQRYIDAANASLEEWNYDIRLSMRDFWVTDKRWVDPKHITEEGWPDSAVSSEPVDGWVKLYRFDLENMPNRAIDTKEDPDGA